MIILSHFIWKNQALIFFFWDWTKDLIEFNSIFRIQPFGQESSEGVWYMLGTLLDAWHVDTNRLVSLTDTISDFRDRKSKKWLMNPELCVPMQSPEHTPGSAVIQSSVRWAALVQGKMGGGELLGTMYSNQSSPGGNICSGVVNMYSNLPSEKKERLWWLQLLKLAFPSKFLLN